MAEPMTPSLPAEIPMGSVSRQARAVFLDRDGVINHNRLDHVKSWAEFQFLDGSLEALARLAATDFTIVIASNQSVIGRGLAGRETIDDIHRRMMEQIERAGGRIHRILYCPHRPDQGCTCRKPRPGLLLEAGRELGLDLPRSYFIGDSLKDMEAGIAVGCTTVLVRTGLGEETYAHLHRLTGRPSAVVNSLAEAVDWILEREQCSDAGPSGK